MGIAAASNDMPLRLVEFATVAKQENCTILFAFYEPPGSGSLIGTQGIRHTEVTEVGRIGHAREEALGGRRGA